MAEKGINSLLLRTFNQDSLENFFGSIRSLGYRSNSPSTTAFSSAYKTILINNLTSTSSPGNNCEEDFAEGCLTTYKHFFADECIYIPSNLNLDPRVANGQLSERSINTSDIDNLRTQTQYYIAGFIAKKLNVILFKGCELCISQICTLKKNKNHIIIEAREYNTNKLCLKYPNFEFSSLVQNIMNEICCLLPSICHYSDLKAKLTSIILQKFEIPHLICQTHGKHFSSVFLNYIINEKLIQMKETVLK